MKVCTTSSPTLTYPHGLQAETIVLRKAKTAVIVHGLSLKRNV